jgi:hypothetical protein
MRNCSATCGDQVHTPVDATLWTLCWGGREAAYGHSIPLGFTTHRKKLPAATATSRPISTVSGTELSLKPKRPHTQRVTRPLTADNKTPMAHHRTPFLLCQQTAHVKQSVTVMATAMAMNRKKPPTAAAAASLGEARIKAGIMLPRNPLRRVTTGRDTARPAAGEPVLTRDSQRRRSLDAGIRWDSGHDPRECLGSGLTDALVLVLQDGDQSRDRTFGRSAQSAQERGGPLSHTRVRIV